MIICIFSLQYVNDYISKYVLIFHPIFAALESIRKTTTNNDLHDACSVALFMVDDMDTTPQGAAHDMMEPSTSDGCPHIMISYQHESQKKMLKVKAYLESKGYNVWMDVDKMSKYIILSLATKS